MKIVTTQHTCAVFSGRLEACPAWKLSLIVDDDCDALKTDVVNMTCRLGHWDLLLFVASFLDALEVFLRCRKSSHSAERNKRQVQLINVLQRFSHEDALALTSVRRHNWFKRLLLLRTLTTDFFVQLHSRIVQKPKGSCGQICFSSKTCY